MLERQRTLRLLGAAAIVGAGYLLLHVVDDDRVTALLVVGIGVMGLWLGARLDRRQHARLADIGGPGWWLTWLISKMPFGVGRLAWLAMSAAIVAVGVWGVVEAA